ncbi:MAG: fumarylacetoacetate hydrolase family protein, partial [Hyphomicrobiales bacterium]
MKFLTFEKSGKPSWGMVRDDGVVDLGNVADDLQSYIAAGFPEVQRLENLPISYALENVTFAPVIPSPSKIVMAALNYFETGDDRSSAPEYPVLFLRLAASQIGHETPMLRPRSSEKLDYEGELAVIVGQGGRHIPQAQAMDHICGY